MTWKITRLFFSTESENANEITATDGKRGTSGQRQVRTRIKLRAPSERARELAEGAAFRGNEKRETPWHSNGSGWKWCSRTARIARFGKRLAHGAL